MKIGNYRRRQAGVSLLELLCTIAIIGILAGLYFGAISRAGQHFIHFFHKMEGWAKSF